MKLENYKRQKRIAEFIDKHFVYDKNEKIDKVSLVSIYFHAINRLSYLESLRNLFEEIDSYIDEALEGWGDTSPIINAKGSYFTSFMKKHKGELTWKRTRYNKEERRRRVEETIIQTAEFFDIDVALHYLSKKKMNVGDNDKKRFLSEYRKLHKYFSDGNHTKDKDIADFSSYHQQLLLLLKGVPYSGNQYAADKRRNKFWDRINSLCTAEGYPKIGIQNESFLYYMLALYCYGDEKSYEEDSEIRELLADVLEYQDLLKSKGAFSGGLDLRDVFEWCVYCWLDINESNLEYQARVDGYNEIATFFERMGQKKRSIRDRIKYSIETIVELKDEKSKKIEKDKIIGYPKNAKSMPDYVISKYLEDFNYRNSGSTIEKKMRDQFELTSEEIENWFGRSPKGQLDIEDRPTKLSDLDRNALRKFVDNQSIIEDIEKEYGDNTQVKPRKKKRSYSSMFNKLFTSFSYKNRNYSASIFYSALVLLLELDYLHYYEIGIVWLVFEYTSKILLVADTILNMSTVDPQRVKDKELEYPKYVEINTVGEGFTNAAGKFLMDVLMKMKDLIKNDEVWNILIEQNTNAFDQMLEDDKILIPESLEAVMDDNNGYVELSDDERKKIKLSLFQNCIYDIIQ